MNVRFWLAHPQLIPARLKYWLWERLNPDKPWLCSGTVTFCEKHFRGSKQGLEFGSGRSTQWFAKLTEHLTSVEHNPEWHAIVEKQLKAASVGNVDYRLVALDHPETEPERPSYDPLPRYVAQVADVPDGSLDFVIVDGPYRTTCMRAAVSKLRPGGYLLVDDVERWPDRSALPIPAGWTLADDSTNGIKQTCIWQAPAV